MGTKSAQDPGVPADTNFVTAESTSTISTPNYGRLFDNLLEGCMVIGFDWTYLYLNEVAARHGNGKRADLLGRSMLEVYPGVEQSELFAHYRACMEQRTPQHFESSFTFADGSVNWYQLRVEPAPEGILVLSLDITERKRAEDELRARTLDLEIINAVNEAANHGDGLQGMADAFAQAAHTAFDCRSVAIHLLSPDGKYLEMQSTTLPKPAVAQVGKLLGTPVSAQGRVPLEKSAYIRRLLDNTQGVILQEEGEIQEWIGQFAETTFLPESLRAQGRKLVPQIVKSINIHSVLILPLASEGNALGLLVISSKEMFDKRHLERMEYIGRQITATILRQRTEQALRESEEKYRGLIESLDTVVSMFDVNGRLMYLNEVAAEQFGGTVPGMIGKTIHELFPEPVASRQLASIQRVFHENQALTVESVSLIQGQPRWYRTSIQPLHDDRGRVTSVLVIASDIHELKTAQQELQALNRTLEERVEERTAELMQINAALEASQASVQSFYDSAPFMMGIADLDGDRTVAVSGNRAIAEFLAQLPENLPGQTGSELGTPEDMERLWVDAYRRSQERRESVRFEYQFPHVNGLRWLAATTTFIDIGAAGRPRFSFVVEDITERREAETLLRQSEERYAALFNKSAVPAILSKLPEGTFADVNEVFTQQYGYAREDMLGKTSVQIGLIRPGDRPHLFKVFDEQGLYAGTEVSVFTKWGEERIVLLNGNEIDFAGGSYVITTAYDITGQKLAESALRASEERMKLAFQAAQDGIWDWNMETDEVFYSSRWKRMLGYEDAEIEPHASAWKRLLHPDDLPRAMQVVEEVLRGEREYVMEFRMRHKDGYYVEILSRGFPIRRESDGSIMRIVGTHFDLTERKHAEQALRDSEMQNRLLFDESPVATALLNVEGDVVRTNRAFQQLLGFTTEEVEAQPTHALGLLSAEDFDRFDDLLRGAHSEMDHLPVVEHLVRRADGSQFDAAIRIFPLALDGAAHLLVTVIDVSAYKTAEELLRSANAEMEHAMRMKDEFLATMSHELRTPLTGILGNTELLQLHVGGPLTPRQENQLEKIELSGRHLLSLINDILDLSKIEAGKMELEIGPVEVSALCRASLAFVREAALKQHLSVDYRCEPADLSMLADERRLKQILINLLGNAVKFTPAHGQVHLNVQADRQQAAIRFEVVDTGIGIAAQDIERLFSPFTQVDSSLTRRHMGTGLGLALVKRMTNMHGGEISVESEPGKGSRFIVTLPWQQPPDKGAAPVSTMPAAMAVPAMSEATTRRRILIVEDNVLLAESIVEFLEASGYELRHAPNGREVFGLAADFHPDLVLMDIQMPDMDGLEVTRRLRQTSEFGTIPIIAVTALAMAGDRDVCLAAGANDYIAKPLSLSALLQAIRVQLDH